ncbi:chymotrypsin-C-like isoform X2 [Epargyreus clarus]|uniref:chymotrypsin-C-like isoform X2 n=1 Tax=Epargyreus clarus TaxID=520877 RepID=UPI003C2B91BB
MKLNLSLMKLIIRLLIILILFVALLLVSLVLYSARYWPDVYNYINANITIKRIPTITETNCGMREIIVTEIYTTTDNDIDETTAFDDNGFNLDDIDFDKRKRSVNDDYSEVPAKTVVVDYFFDIGEDLVKDLINESELTTRVHDVEMLAGDYGVKVRSMEANNINEELSSSVFPWIVAIFLKNSTSDQFNYYCDGALLSNRTVITAASCVQQTSNTENLLLLFGKKSLKTMTEVERVSRVKTIKIHGNFSTQTRDNDLAILILEEPIIFSDNIQSATLNEEELKGNMATTGWAITGELTPILLKTGDNVTCDVETEEDKLCAVYGNDVTVCPSYGGLYVTKQEAWYLQGLRTADPEDRGLCINRNIAFTSFKTHWEWIKENI